jgi:hypothetical protein
MPDSNAIKAGEAFVELTTRNNVGPGIAAAKRDISTLIDSTKAVASAQLSVAGSAAEAKKHLFFEDAAKSAAKLGIGVGLLTTGYDRLFVALGGQQAFEKFDKQLERSTELAGKLAEATARIRGTIHEGLGVGAPNQRSQSLGAEITREEKEAGGQASALRGARAGASFATAYRQEIEKKLALDPLNKDIGGDLEYAKLQEKAAAENLKEMQARYEATKATIRDLKKEKRDLDDPTSSIAWRKSLDETTKSLKEQADTVGMTAEQVAVYKLRTDAALGDPAKLAAALAPVKELATNATWKRIANDIAETSRQWEIQAKTIGMTAEEAKVYGDRMNAIKDLGVGAAAAVDKAFAGLQKQASDMLATNATKTLTDAAKGWKDAALTAGLSPEAGALAIAGRDGASQAARTAAAADARRKINAELAAQTQQVDDDLEEKRRLAGNAVGGGSKSTFGAFSGSGQFDYGGGGPWQGIGVTMKDLLDSEQRKEKLQIDANRKLDEINRSVRTSGDTFAI